MKRMLLKIVSFTIVIGVLAIAINTAFGMNTITFLQKQQININTTHFYIWKFNYWSYLNNLQLSTSNLSILVFDMPTRQWSNTNDWSALTNNLLVMLDYVIMIINILLYPIKIGAYLLQNLLALFGVNQDINAENNGLAWLVQFVQNILSNFAIPYL